MTRLLIISHTPHYRCQGKILGWGPTVREIDYLAELFSEIVHVAPLHPDSPPASALPYQSNKVLLRSVKPSGGKRVRDKFGILLRFPHYLRVITAEMKQADAIHIRCPANISLLALLTLVLSSSPRLRWIKYAGNWKPDGNDHLSYAFQRWLLQHPLHRGVVTINGNWQGQPSHVYSFPNPSLDDDDIEIGWQAASSKHLHAPINLLYVGRVEQAKGTGRTIRIASELSKRGIDFQLNIVGNGPQHGLFEQLSNDLGLSESVLFHGWQPRTELNEFYANAHFVLLPSSAAEGWPKVLSEAMAFGAVPLASTVASIPQILSRAGTGHAIPADDVQSFAAVIEDYLSCPDSWRKECEAGLKASRQFTYRSYQKKIRALFSDTWSMMLA